MAILRHEADRWIRRGLDHSPPLWWSRMWVGILAAGLALAPTSRCQSWIGESEVKAAFLFNFAKFIEWPPGTFSSATTPIQFCVLGNELLGMNLRQIVEGKQIDGRALQVLSLGEAESGRECQVLFVSASEERQGAQLLKELRRAPVVTVGEMPNFTIDGGVISFAMINSHVTLEVNIDAASRAHLAISSKLLALAKITHDAPATAGRD